MKTFDIAYPVYRPDELFFKSIDRIMRQNILPECVWLMLTTDEEWNANRLLDELRNAGIALDRIHIVEIEKSEFNHGNTRNLAAELCESDYLMFMTQDAVPADKKLCSEMVKALSGCGNGQKAAVAYARQLAGKNADIIESFSRLYNYPPVSENRDEKDLAKKGIKAIFCSDACAIYNMEIFRALGGFEKNVNFNEDELYAYKALKNSYNVIYCAEARVFHSHEMSLKEQYKRSVEIAKSQEEHKEIFGKLSSEKEGMKYFRQGFKYMMKKGNILDGARFIVYCGVRYIGYKTPKIKESLNK